MLSADQIRELEAPLSREAVKTREQSGKTYSFIESWHAIAEANRIFGFGGWSSQTVEVNCVVERERLIGKRAEPGWAVTYNAKVRVTVEGIFHDGVGSGHGIGTDIGLAHESAIKEAESDARKRALMQFGNQFGLALYDKEQVNVADTQDEIESRNKYIARCKTAIASFRDGERDAILKWWYDNEKARSDFGLSNPEIDELKGLAGAKANLPKVSA
jgi:DNA recombination protein Rad52